MHPWSTRNVREAAAQSCNICISWGLITIHHHPLPSKLSCPFQWNKWRGKYRNANNMSLLPWSLPAAAFSSFPQIRGRLAFSARNPIQYFLLLRVILICHYIINLKLNSWLTDPMVKQLYAYYNTFKYHVSCTELKISVEIIYFYYLFFHRRLTNKLCFLSCRPYIVNATFSTGLVVSSLSWLGSQARIQKKLQDLLKMSS